MMILLDHQHTLTSLHQIGCGHFAGNAGTYHNDVVSARSVCTHTTLIVCEAHGSHNRKFQKTTAHLTICGCFTYGKSMTFLVKILVSLAILAVDILVQTLTQRAIDRYVTRYRMSHKRNLVMHKTKSVLLHGAALVAIVLMWGVSIENVWVSIAGILGLVAIGFFAVWSILSNIFAGIVLFFNRPFKIEDTIELLPDGIRGRVKDINGFFVLLEDEDGNTINIPNNLVFQKIMKNLGR